ncbi:unnamed protein product [Cylindrotheca closterium]|uniref:Uncharacterized protein n=1 Tax=Cylindrotheca closterium TaxID=2856 RepID=A0AAD2G6I6_9STRA|nr:unnamed protein product [Cylindrotheca closterium]
MLRQNNSNASTSSQSTGGDITKNNHQQREQEEHQKKKGSRGISPFSLRSRGTSPSDGKPRGISPFGKKNRNQVVRKQSSSDSSSSLGSSSHHHHHHHQESKEDIVVCHGSARSIVFRDQLRLAAKIIQEETDQDMLMMSDDDDDNGSNHSGNEADAGFESMQAAMRDSIRVSIRESDGGNKVTNEINSLAHNMVPELKDVTLRVQDVSERNVEIEGQQVHLKPLPKLELGPTQTFDALENDKTTDMDKSDWNMAEQDVYQLLKKQQACVKTIKNSEWPSFLQRFQVAKNKEQKCRFPTQHEDIPPNHQEGYPFNSFVTSTTLLPELGKKMRCYGSLYSYPVGVVFALPNSDSPNEEDDAAAQAKTWSWPAGYAAKTEFNIERGKLINGRQEALVSLTQLRQYNKEYVYEKDHYIGGRLVKGGFQVVPYNEVFLRVGGRGRIVQGMDTVTREARNDVKGTGRSFGTGMGLPVALFIRSCTIGDILTLLRTKARVEHVLGDQYIHGIPLLVITPDCGVRVFSERLQHAFWKLAAHRVNPFQNPILEPSLKVDDPNQNYLHQKALEQISFLDDDYEDDGNAEWVSSYLTIEECARLAGGFGATDEFLAKLLEKAREQDLLEDSDEENLKSPRSSHRRRNRHDSLNNVMSTALNAALRSNDYYTARQLLIVYSIVSTGHYHDRFEHNHQGSKQKGPNNEISDQGGNDTGAEDPTSLEFAYRVSETATNSALPVSKQHEKVPDEAAEQKEEKSFSPQFTPVLPSLDTWRLRNATNSQGILFVLGAVEILSAARSGSAQSRAKESIVALDEWVQYGEESVAFRIASWSKQRATEHDTHVALEGSSQFMAFVSNKAITNRKGFAKKLQSALEAEKGADAVASSEESHLCFLKRIQEIVNSLHAPCLRLEILQYILGLDNRFSVDHIRHSMELAVTCMVLGLS